MEQLTAIKQSSFAGGILAPNLYGSSHLQKWQYGLVECNNYWINRYGNVENRSGTQYVGTTPGLRVIGFVLSPVQAYEITLSNEFFYDSLAIWFNIWTNGQRLTTPFSGLPAWAGGTTYTRGQIVSYLGTAYISLLDSNVGHTPDALLSPNWYPITTDTDGNTYIQFPIWETAVGVFPGTSVNVGIIQTLDIAQFNELMFFVNHAFKPFSLEYHSDVYWRINANIIENPIPAPTGLASTIGTAGAVLYRYAVCAVASDLTTQGPLAFGPALAVTTVATTASNPYLVTTAAAHHLQSNDLVQFSFTLLPLGGNVTLTPGVDYTVTVTGATTFTINGTVGAGVTAAGAPGNYMAYFVAVTTATPSAVAPNVISWNLVDVAARYNIYEFSQGVWAFIGSTSGLSFNDVNITPNGAAQPSTNIPMFQTSSDWPSVVGVYQQRLMFANTLNQPQSYWASRIGYYGVFNVSTPTNDADAFTFTLAGKQVQFITALVDIGKLIIHTSNGEYVAAGNQSGGLTPTAQNVTQVGYAGSASGIAPVPIGITDLFVQARGGMIRDLAFNVQVFNYQGKDTSLFASNLFHNRTVVSMAWQQIPDSILWVVMSDGALIAMTYNKEMDMWAWHEHQTGTVDQVLSVTCVSEGMHDVPYALVSRTSTKAGHTRTITFLERLTPRAFTDIRYDANFTDCALHYDGVNTNTSKHVTATTAGGWTPSDTITLASTGLFTALDATYGNVIVLRNGTQTTYTDSVSFTIIGFTDTAHVTARPQKNVPAWAQALAITNYGKAVSHFSGMPYANIPINILGDGNVEQQQTLDDLGAFVTTRPYLNVWAGIPITATMQTLDWENQQGETISGKQKNIVENIIVFCESRGGLYGSADGTLVRFPQRAAEPYDVPNYLFTGPKRFPVIGTWKPSVGIVVEQRDPLPMCISALSGSGSVGT